MSEQYQPLLESTYNTTRKLYGMNPSQPENFKQMLSDDRAFQCYKDGLSEGLTESDKSHFCEIADSTRTALMENSMFQLNPYETLHIPILRVFYPKLIAKELVNVMPIDKPEVIMSFLKAYFAKSTETNFDHQFPAIYDSAGNQLDISRGPSSGITVRETANVGEQHDILDEMPGYLDSSKAHIEKDFRITEVYSDSQTEWKTLDTPIKASIDGYFSQSVTIGSEDGYIQGEIDFLEGILTVSSTNSDFTQVAYQAYASLEENQINPKMKMDFEKIPFSALDRRIETEWTVNMEQDVKALYDIQIQSDIVSILGEQIAIDVDREIINDIIDTNATANPASHTKSFDLNPPTEFTWGRKAWYENILPELNKLSAQIYNSVLIGPANTLACNPLDAAVFESLNQYELVGDSVAGGEVGYRSATVAGGKWKLLVSNIVPEGKVIAKHRSPELLRAAYVYAPYVPVLLQPYPMGPIPALTIMTRYAKNVVRPNAFGVMEIEDSAS
ncbi:MAG: hypothetical protein ACOCQD_00500 [archaeon]